MKRNFNDHFITMLKQIMICNIHSVIFIYKSVVNHCIDQIDNKNTKN
jgi:hypothetical protein